MAHTTNYFDRTAICVILAGCFVVAIGWGRGKVNDDLDRAFWARKYTWSQNADVVLAGDSRVLYGVSPDVLGEKLGVGRVLNFGFPDLGFTDDYLRAVENVVDMSAARPMIILGITPKTLTPNAQKHNFFMCRSVFETPTFTARLPDWAKCFYLRIDPAKSVEEWFSPRPVREPYANGWMAVDYQADTPFAEDERYHLIFLDNQVDKETIERVMQYVQAWRERGIEVVGFRPPTSEEMLAVEGRYSGFEQEEFRRRFTAAGGRWVDTSLYGYDSYDNSHLTREGAITFSRELARHIEAAPVQLSQEMTVSN